MPARRSAPTRSSPLRQRGATALEFGLVFPALFVLFYGTLTFALIFTARMGLQHEQSRKHQAELKRRCTALA